MKKLTRKIWSRSFLVILLLIVLSSCGVHNENDKRIEIRIAHASSENSATHVVCEAFVEKATELLGDRVSIKIFPNATLGSEAEMVEGLQMGTLEAATFGRHSAIDSRMEILNLPFLFDSDAHAEKVLRGKEGVEIREKLSKIMLENNIVPLGWYETGFRVITSNRKIEHYEDLSGLLIRTPSTDTLIKSFQAWGASPTAVDLSELYTSLQSGVVDAQENPYQLIDTNNLYEVQDYLCITNHLTIPNQLVFSKKVWDTYPNDIQAALYEAGEYACNVGGEYNIEKNNSLLSVLESKMIVTYMDDVSLERMKKLASEKVWPQFISEENETYEVINEIISLR